MVLSAAYIEAEAAQARIKDIERFIVTNIIG